MRDGSSLTDAERAAWLTLINEELHCIVVVAEQLPIMGHSALKQRYRDALKNGLSSLAIVFLQLPQSMAESRVASRTDHYMPASLGASQFADLEPLKAGRGIVSTDATIPLGKLLLSWIHGGICYSETAGKTKLYWMIIWYLSLSLV